MDETKLIKLKELIDKDEIDKAELELSKIYKYYSNNSEFRYLESQLFYKKNFFYKAIDSLLLGLTFAKKTKYFESLSKIYEKLQNFELKNNFLNPDTREKTLLNLKKDMTGFLNKEGKLIEIEELIDSGKLEKAEIEIAKLTSYLLKNPEYLYLRALAAYKRKRNYTAIDTLIIALTFKKSTKYFNLLSKIYNELENFKLSEDFFSRDLQEITLYQLTSEMRSIKKR